jgi:aspartate racemase
MKTIGIVAHSIEGATLCFLTAYRQGAVELGEFMHPTIVMSAVPLALSMPGWDSGDHQIVAKHLIEGVERVADGGADFFVCPDNTAHIVLESIIDELPIPGLHIADVVCHEITGHGWESVGLLGTRWTMTGPVYERALQRCNLERLLPDEDRSRRIHETIFEELCNGMFEDETTDFYVETIDALRSAGAECVILGCTEIPLIVTPENSPLPILDSTRLLARYAVREALREGKVAKKAGWLPVDGSR